MNTQWDAPTKRTAAIILCVLFIYVIYLSRAILSFLVIAALIAFLLVPLVSFFNNKLRIPKGIAVLLAYVVLLLFVFLFPLILIPAMLDAFGDINIDIIALASKTLVWATRTLEAYRFIDIHTSLYSLTYDLSSVVDPALDTLNNISPTTFIPSLDTIITSIPSTVQLTWGIASNVLGTLVATLLALILILLYSVYLTADGGKFIRGFINLAPLTYRPEFFELNRRIRAIWAAYFRGQFILALIIGVLTWVVGMSIGLPGALALGVIAGVMEILPNLGPILAAIPALLVALVQGSTTLDVSNFTFMLIVLGAYVLIQQLENNLVVPKVLGDAVELHPLIVMVAVVVGATTGGLLGALVAAPTVATGRVLVAYTYSKILGTEPFPPVEDALPPPPTLLERWYNLRNKSRTLVNRIRKLTSGHK